MRTRYPSYRNNTPNRVGAPLEVDKNPLAELGVAGAKISYGMVMDEYNPNLRGVAGRKTYREMRDNDSVIGAIFFAIEMLLRTVPWEFKYDEVDTDAMTSFSSQIEGMVFNRSIDSPEKGIDFATGVFFEDMEHTWDDFISQTISSMCTFGWSYPEIVLKRRMGIISTKPEFRSIYNDGLIGLRKLADRPPETLDRWDIDDQGNIFGMYQSDPNGAGEFYIPMDKALLFRPFAHKGSPEGRSLLRNAYDPWYYLKRIKQIEAIAIERELNGLPVVYAPSGEIWDENGSLTAVGLKYQDLVKNVKYNEQGGVVLPSDPYIDDEGNPTSVKKVSLELLSTNGTRAVDTVKVKEGYQRDIARTVLAQFLMDTNKGSQARSKNESSIFFNCLDALNDSIAEVINRHMIPKLWMANLLDPTYMPYVSPGKVTPVDLQILGEYISKIGGLGFNLFDEDTENYLRSLADLPDRPEGMDDVELFPEEDIETKLPGNRTKMPKKEKAT